MARRRAELEEDTGEVEWSQEQWYAREIKKPEYDPLPHNKLLQLAERVRQKDPDARKEMIERNVRFAHTIAREFARRRGLEFSDIVQHANIGLMAAVDHFKPSEGFRFTTYAVWWIKQAIRRAFHDEGATIRVPVRFQELCAKVWKETLRFETEYERIPTPNEIASRLDISLEQARMSLAILRRGQVSLEELVSPTTPLGYHEVLPQRFFISPETSALLVDEIARVKTDVGRVLKVVKKLPPKQQDMFWLKYFGNRANPEIAVELHCSRANVRQSLIQVWKRIRQKGVPVSESWLQERVSRLNMLQEFAYNA